MSNAIIPLDGIHHMFSVTMLGAPQVTSWYIAPFGNEYRPYPGDTLASLVAAAGEITSYEGETRIEMTPDNPSGGLISNSQSVAEVVFTAPATVRGFFLTSAPAKGSTSGVLLVARLLPSPRIINEAGDKLLVTSGLQIISV